MRITKHEAAVLAKALEMSKYEMIADWIGTKDERIEAFKKIERLEIRLSNYETDNRLQSKSGRAYQYPSLTKIILNKLK